MSIYKCQVKVFEMLLTLHAKYTAYYDDFARENWSKPEN